MICIQSSKPRNSRLGDCHSTINGTPLIVHALMALTYELALTKILRVSLNIPD